MLYSNFPMVATTNCRNVSAVLLFYFIFLLTYSGTDTSEMTQLQMSMNSTDAKIIL
jgi:hypothetical protein